MKKAFLVLALMITCAPSYAQINYRRIPLTIADGKTLTVANTVKLNTMTDGKWCKYSTSGTALDCNVDPVTDTNTNASTGSVTGAVGSVTSGVTVTTNNDKTGYALSAAGIDAIWDEVQSGHATAGSFGAYLDAQVSTVGGGTAADIADAVWNEATADHQTAGTTGKAITDAGAAGNPWEADVSTGYTGQAGEYLRNINNATDGDKEGASYTGIESMIRSNR